MDSTLKGSPHIWKCIIYDFMANGSKVESSAWVSVSKFYSEEDADKVTYIKLNGQISMAGLEKKIIQKMKICHISKYDLIQTWEKLFWKWNA